MMRLLNRIQAWFRTQPLPLPATASVTQQFAPPANDAHVQLVPFDENLLERSRTQWQFGDWASLAALSRDTLQHHPDRAKLALLAAAGHQGLGNAAEARQLTRLAIDWGCSKKLVTQILISGVHNTLGRAAAASGQEQRAHKHFQASIEVGASSSDSKLLTKVRIGEQLCQLGLEDSTAISKIGFREIAPLESDSRESKPDISIVIPVYNLENILEKCLFSIQMQEHQNFEVIIINDGSTDKTSNVVKNFIATDFRFKLIEFVSNKGVSVARNIGISECSGKFIRFVDGDDELPTWSNKSLLENSLNQDMVRGSYTTFSLDQKKTTDFSTDNTISDFHPYSLPFNAKSKLLYGICSILFSSKFIKDNELSFPINKNMGEDAQFMIDAYFLAKRCTLIPDVVYFYKKRMNSLSEKNLIDVEFMLSVANKWMYLFSKSKHTSQLEFAKKAFENNKNGYLKTILAKRDQLSAADRLEVDGVFDILINEYSMRGSYVDNK